MSTIKIYLGLNDKDTHKQRYSMTINKDILKGVLKLYKISAYSLQLVEGVFTHEDGTVVNENTFVITLLDRVIDDYIRELCDELKVTFNQESVGLENIVSHVEFV